MVNDAASFDPAGFEVLVDHRDDAIVLCLVGEVDLSNAEQITEALDQERLECATTLVIDAHGLEFCDSSGIAALARVARACDAHDVTMSIVGVRPSIRRLFEVAGALNMLHVEPE